MRTVVVLLITELLLTVSVSAVAWWTYGIHHAWSALVGGGICIVTTAYFALRVFLVRSDDVKHDGVSFETTGETAAHAVTDNATDDDELATRDAKAQLAASKVVRAFYLAEGQKLILTAVCFIVVIKLMDVAFAPLIIAYVIAHLGYWVILFLSVNWTQAKIA